MTADTPAHVFISHSTHDDDVVERLRQALDDQGVPAWVDARELTAGDALDDEIRQAIRSARHFLVLLSQDAIQSPWVQQEVRFALEVRRDRPDFRVIPLLLNPIGPGILPLFFDQEPVGIQFEIAPGGLSEAMPGLLAALGLRAPEQPRTRPQPEAQPLADLVLELEDPRVEEVEDGKRRALATARLTYKPPAGSGEREVESQRFDFSAPLGPIELGDLAW